MARKAFMIAAALGVAALSTAARAEPCLEVTLTGTQGGPPVFKGQAGAGTLVRYGDSENNCSDVALQFDTGRGTTQQLSKLGVPAGKVTAVFLTHVHSDHSEGLPDLMQLRWHFNSGGPKVDLVCSDDVTAPKGYVMSCKGFAAHIGDADEGDTDAAMEQCLEAVEHLLDLFSNDDSGCDHVDAFLDDLNEALEMMVLMQVEQGDGPAADAVTVLLQLRREIDMKLAA